MFCEASYQSYNLQQWTHALCSWVMLSKGYRASYLAKCLWESFIAPDRGLRVAQTGDIVPAGSLKVRSLRSGLKRAEKSPNKCYTKPVASTAISILQKKYGVQVPIIPGVSPQAWKAQQAKRIALLCYRVKKNRCARATYSTKSSDAMDDQQDTLAYDAEDGLKLTTAH